MSLQYEIRSRQTIETINHLLDNGVQKISVLLRHSDRFFAKEARLEPFMGLTDHGKACAFDFGAAIRSTPLPKLYSSFIGRCVETAFLIDKGFTKKQCQQLEHNHMEPMLSPFYVKDVQKAVPIIEQQGNNRFLRNWFDHGFDESLMENPEKTAELLSKFMIEKIKQLKENQIALCVSHDWNIYPVKEFKLGLKLETSGDVGYLDCIVFFEKNSKFYVKNFQADPILL